MDRAVRANVLAKSGRAVEVAGDVDTLLLDKTGTVTLGNRRATEFVPLDGTDALELRRAAYLSSLADETPEGRSIVELAEGEGVQRENPQDANFIPFSAQTRMSGVDLPDGTEIRKGAVDAIQRYTAENDGAPARLDELAGEIAGKGEPRSPSP